jgi:localization factor PodJL
MNTASAWEIDNLSPAARSVAEDAAHRVGLTLEEWLNEAILEHASSAQLWRGVSSRSPRSPRLGQHGPWRKAVVGQDERGIGRAEDRPNIQSEHLLELTVERIERRITRDEERLTRALDAIALKLEGSNAKQERGDSFRGHPRSDSVETAEDYGGSPSRQGSEAEVAADSGAWSSAIQHPEASEDETASRTATSGEAGLPQEAAQERARLDLKSAISQIALRRMELDAREARKPMPQQRLGSALDRPNANWNVEQTSERETNEEANDADVDSSPAKKIDQTSVRLDGADTLRDDIRALLGKLDELPRERADQRVNPADISAMRSEIAGMARSLEDLAPRNAVVALEGAVRDLTQRVEMLRQTGHRESFLTPLDAMAAELRATLKAHDPKTAAAGLEREIRAIGGKIDGLVQSAIDPESFEGIRRQTEEVRNLLTAAAAHTTPVERLERQIGELADRIERLGSSPTPHIESAQMAASLADVRREIERSTPLPTLTAIERRLEQIATRLDQELVRPDQVEFTVAPFDDLIRRIDGVRATLDARPQPQVETSKMEALLRDLNAKLDAPGQRDDEGRRLEPVLEGILSKLDHFQLPEASVTSGSMRMLEDMLHALDAKLDRQISPLFDRQAIQAVAEEIALRLRDGRVGRAEADLLAEQITIIHDRLDALAGSSRQLNGLELLVEELLERLRVSTSNSGGTPADSQSDLAAGLAQLSAEQANADRRTQLRLSGVQDLLETLVTRLARSEGESSKDGAPPQRQARDTTVGDPSLPAHPSPDAIDGDGAAGSVQVRRKSSPDTPANACGLTTPSAEGEDFLLEPGAGAPKRAQEARDLAQAIGVRTNLAVSAHIAAARRAAQGASGETGVAARTRPANSRSVRQARTFYDNHKRSVLLAVALAIVATVAVRLVGSHPPFLQGSDSGGRPVNSAAAPSSKGLDLTRAGRTDARPVDITPTASIATPSDTPKANAAAGSLPPELISAIPVALPQGLRDAIVAGSPNAQYELAQRLFEGRDLQQDQHAAALWFERAASMGLAPAQFRIGALYQKGVGVVRDAAAAKRWYTRAAAAGNARAAHNLAVMNAEPVDERPDYAEAAKWFREAAELGVRDSQYNLAVLYARGLGVEQDLRQSWLWFSLAAAQGDSDAAKKRDEVSVKMDPASLAAAADELAKFKVAKPDPAANEVAAPPGGWDVRPLGQMGPVLGRQRS